MFRRLILASCAGLMSLAVWHGSAAPARAQESDNLQLDRFFYYPYYYFPHNYWPSQGPKWPEAPGSPHPGGYPAYMAYPPFREPNWRFEMWEPQRYYRGFHFWLDQF